MSNKPPENKESGDYEIGYAKPPLHTRFRKGHSSNPNGRPRGSKSFATLVNKALEQPVVLRKNGRTMTKRELLAEQLVNKAASGDYRATRLLTVELAPSLEKRAADPPQRGLSATAAERIRSALIGVPWNDQLNRTAKRPPPDDRG
jgi:Family of unknown function (DUF5681)